MTLFSGGTIFITLSYLISALLIFTLILHTVWRGRSAKKKIADLTGQQNAVSATGVREEHI